MHSTIINNLLILTECGAFGSKPEEGDLSFMSPYKWRQLVAAAEQLKVLPYVAMASEQLKGCKPLIPAFYDCLSEPERKVVAEPYNVGDVHLFNHWTDKRLEELKEEEMNSRETSDETLMLLDMIVRNAVSMIQKDVDIDGIIALGLYIRQYKEKIDYEKLGRWLSRIGLINMASLMGNMLTLCLHIPQEDVPLAIKQQPVAQKLFMNRVVKAFEKHHCSNAARLNNAFVETVSHKFVSAISLVTDIEE